MKLLAVVTCIATFMVIYPVAQTFKITGNVSTDSIVVKNALITFTNHSDTLEQFSAVTDSTGNYSIALITGVAEIWEIPTSFQLMQNYPNPFTDQTIIPFRITKSVNAEMRIFNILGEEVKSINLGSLSAGIQSIIWDGRNNTGNKVSAGVYFCRMTAGKDVQVKKMLLNPVWNSNKVPGNFLLKPADEGYRKGKSFRIKITNTNDTEPKIKPFFSNIEIDNDTTFNFIIGKVENEILFIADTGDPLNGVLYLTDIDKTYIKKVIDSVYTAGTARWSPDGQWIAFEGAFGYYENYEIYIVKADGTGKRIVTRTDAPEGGTSPVWSPDGRKIAFSKCLNCEFGGSNFEIFILSIDSSQDFSETRLTYNLVEDYVWDWSPDGNKILFTSGLTTDSVYDFYRNIYTMNTNGEEKTQILDVKNNSAWVYAMRFSPDGSFIAFSTLDGTILINSDGTNARKISSISGDLRNAGNQISWSYDSKYILCPGLYLISSDGSGNKDFLFPGIPGWIYSSPDWRPINK